DSRSQARLGSRLKTRLKLLSDLEAFLNRAISEKDWLTQMQALKLVGDEYLRLYQDILSLPMPEGLTAAQEQEYLQAINEQAQPHQQTAQQYLTKYSEFWQGTTALDNF